MCHVTIPKIRVEQISPNPNQARIDFDKAGLAELAKLIKAMGLLQPIIVNPYSNKIDFEELPVRLITRGGALNGDRIEKALSR